MSLIDELQRDALNDEVNIATVLRKALVIASVLNLPEFERWINYELDGYRDVEVPEYRRIRGTVYVSNTPYAPIRMTFPNSESESTFTICKFSKPLEVSLELLRGNSSGKIRMDFPPAVQRHLLSADPDLDGLPYLEIDRSQFALIQGAVRTAILRWSLQLRRDGIIGEGISFSPDEIEVAAQHRQELLPPMQIGSVSNSTFQILSPGASSSVNQG